MRMLKGLVVLVVFCLVGAGSVFGETIYLKDGEIIEAEISEKEGDTIWYEVDSGDMIEYVGLEISEIEKILNDDGTVSEYSP